MFHVSGFLEGQEILWATAYGSWLYGTFLPSISSTIGSLVRMVAIPTSCFLEVVGQNMLVQHGLGSVVSLLSFAGWERDMGSICSCIDIASEQN